MYILRYIYRGFPLDEQFHVVKKLIQHMGCLKSMSEQHIFHDVLKVL